MKKILFSFFLTTLSIFSFAQNTVVDIIVNSTDHDTLEAAVIAAGLADDLSGTGPFTVFAPTDAAFALLPAGTIETLLSDTTELANILLYHVVGNQDLLTDLTNGQSITTLQGQTVVVTIDTNGIDTNGVVFINNAEVIVADIIADNGVVHVIDVVLIPQQETLVSNTHDSKLKFQNPVADNILIPMSNNSNVQILSTSGQVVYSQNFNGSINVDTRSLSNGIYLMKVESKNTNQVVKFIK